MSKLTKSLAAKLDDCIIENFADIYVLDDELDGIAKKHDLDDPNVIAAIATVADVAAAQERLIERPPNKLAAGLQAALARGSLRDTAALLVRALLDGAQREVGGPAVSAPVGKKPKPLPAFARPSRLPPLVDAKGKQASAAEVELLLRAIAASKLGDPPDAPYTAESLARFGRALALGWLSHGAEPKHVWGAWAAAHFPDDATARDLGMMARELGPRVGQFSKAQILVDVLAAMNTRASLEALHELATKVKTRSVKDRARAAFDAAAKRTGISEHDLADKLIADDAPVGKDFVKRLERRMVAASRMSAVELVENILQRDAVRVRARGVVFGAQVKSKLVTFTIADEGELVTSDGEAFTLPSDATIVVVHPLDLTAAQLKKWRAQIAGAPFRQLDRPVRRFASLRALTKHLKAQVKRATQGSLYGLESFGWKRSSVTGGYLSSLSRELDGITVTIQFEPGIYVGRGMPPSEQRITSIEARGKGPPRAMAELARELETLRR